MPWRIDFEGEVYREGDLTLGQCEQIEDATGQSWLSINPMRSAKQARVILETVVSARTGKSVDEIRQRVSTMSIDSFLDAFHATESDEDDKPTEYVDGNPQPADESLTGS